MMWRCGAGCTSWCFAATLMKRTTAEYFNWIRVTPWNENGTQSDTAGANRDAACYFCAHSSNCGERLVLQSWSRTFLCYWRNCQLQNVFISESIPISQPALAPNTWLTSVSFPSSSRFIDNFSKLWNCGGRFRTWWGWSKHHWVQTAACQPTPYPGKRRQGDSFYLSL